MNTNTSASSKDNEGSHLFLVRLWPKEKVVEGNPTPNPNPNQDPRANGEWSGRVQHVMSGEAHNFHEWGALIEWLLTMMPTVDTPQQEETNDVF